VIAFVCENPEIQKTLAKLGDILMREGAYFHPDLRAVCRDNNFSMHGAPSLKRGDVAVHIPDPCLVNVESFTFSAQNNLIGIDSVREKTPAIEQELMALMIRLYNLSGKLEQFSDSSVYRFYYECPDLYSALAKGCSLRQKKYLDETPMEQVFLRGFFDVRTLRIPDENNGKTRVVAPFIEYFNHNQNALSADVFHFKAGKIKRNGMGAYAWPLPGSDELFIYYGSYDARELLVYEGFFDDSLARVKSIPLEFAVEGKKVIIYQQAQGPSLDEMPSAIADLHGYCPYFDTSIADTLRFTFLYIPDSAAPRSLQRILFHGLHALVKDKDAAMNMMRMAEQKIISENLAYYKDLKKRLNQFKLSAASKDFTQKVKGMVERQIAAIENYSLAGTFSGH
jgi:hypothetical protein